MGTPGAAICQGRNIFRGDPRGYSICARNSLTLIFYAFVNRTFNALTSLCNLLPALLLPEKGEFRIINVLYSPSPAGEGVGG